MKSESLLRNIVHEESDINPSTLNTYEDAEQDSHQLKPKPFKNA